MSEKVEIIKQLSQKHDVKLLCRLLKLPRSTYYAALNRKPSKRSLENQGIMDNISVIYEGSKKRYGCIKIKYALEKYGIHISQNRVLRLMRKMKIRSIICRKYRQRSRSVDNVERQNLIKRQFHADKPNKIWLTDITYVWTTRNGWTYLAVVLDLCTKKAVGYGYSKNMTAQLATEALMNACKKQGFPKDVTLHSDQGSQYTSELFIQTALRLNMRLSYSAKGCPIDNSPMESFNAIFKKEEVYLNTYTDFDDAKLKIFDFIEGFYNRNRIHSSINFMTPTEFESSFFDTVI